MSRLLNAVFANDLAEIVSLLDRDPKRIQDTESLCQGIGWGHLEAVKLLVQRGADLNTKDRNNNHPLNMACQSPALELFDELVRHGSNPARAIGLAADAAMCGRTDILVFLHRAGFDMNEPGTLGVRPVEAAIGMGHLATVEYLLSVEVDITAIDISKPLKPWKGALPDAGVMEEIRRRIITKRSEKSGPTNGIPPFR